MTFRKDMAYIFFGDIIADSVNRAIEHTSNENRRLQNEMQNMRKSIHTPEFWKGELRGSTISQSTVHEIIELLQLTSKFNRKVKS